MTVDFNKVGSRLRQDIAKTIDSYSRRRPAAPIVGFSLTFYEGFDAVYPAIVSAADLDSLGDEDYFLFVPAEWPRLPERSVFESLNELLSENRQMAEGEERIQREKNDAIFDVLLDSLLRAKSSSLLGSGCFISISSPDPSPADLEYERTSVRVLNSKDVLDRWEKECGSGAVE